MRLLATFTVLLLLLAGCAGKAEDKAASGTSSSTSTTSGGNQTLVPPTPPAGNATNTTAGPVLTLEQCRNFGGVFPVPMDAAQTALPDGFKPIASPSDPAGGATLYVLAVECLASQVDGVATGAALLTYAELAVVPPDPLKIPGIDDYTVPLMFVSNVTIIGEQLLAFGFPNSGETHIGWTASEPTGTHAFELDFRGIKLSLNVQALTAGGGTALSSGGFAMFATAGGHATGAVLGQSEGGTGHDAGATMTAAGLAPLDQARPATRGFSVDGFSLEYSFGPMP